jgi:hypothetical protein
MDYIHMRKLVRFICSQNVQMDYVHMLSATCLQAGATLVACCWAMDYVYMLVRELVRVCRRFREFF